VTLADEFLPTYDVSDAVAVVVDADVDVTWRALLKADLIEVGRRKPFVGRSERCACSPSSPRRSSTASDPRLLSG
jgi:hypothetical protein